MSISTPLLATGDNIAKLAAAKKNAEDDLRSLLEKSASEPTLLTVQPENIRRLRELMNNSETDSDD